LSDILLIIPAYNEEENIEKVIEEIKKYNLDYVIINDGSSDNTKKICEEKKYNIINLAVNLGLAGAFQTGVIYAHNKGYSYVVQFDGDGQHKAEYVESMRKKMDEGFDIVIASRFINSKKPFTMRMLGSTLISFAIKLTTASSIKDPTSGMRMYNKKLIEELAFNINYAPEPDTVSYLIKQGAKVAEVPCTMEERQGGISYLTPFNAISYMLRILSSILFIQNFRKRNKKYFKVVE
jgi:hypothetical protein